MNRLSILEFAAAALVLAAFLSLVGCGSPNYRGHEYRSSVSFTNKEKAPEKPEKPDLDVLEERLKTLEAKVQTLEQDRNTRIAYKTALNECWTRYVEGSPWGTELYGSSGPKASLWISAHGECIRQVNAQFPGQDD